jgi:excisionase family DNA binding protein
METRKLLLRPSEVAELLGLGRSKTYELIAEGAIPSVRIGKCVRVPADRLRERIDELATKDRRETVR